uniref:GST N-terminal domain-containing protein n=1 Tax=Aegilops tauschii subsp. strangulata TaxID=200361 RepID=A0A453RSG3_AEGTS
MATALRLPSLLSSRAAPTTAARATIRGNRAGSFTHRVAAQPDDTTATTSTTPAPPAGFTPPVPKRFEVKPGQSNNIAGAALALPFRLGTGVFVLGYGVTLVDANEISPDQYALDFQGRKVKETSKVGQCPRPAKPIEIYEFEGCPFCRKVREMVSVLDLDVLYYPCPKGSPTFRPKVLEMGGKRQFPYMVDPNTGVAMYESDDIINYLAKTYGDGSVPIMLKLGLLTVSN